MQDSPCRCHWCRKDHYLEYVPPFLRYPVGRDHDRRPFYPTDQTGQFTAIDGYRITGHAPVHGYRTRKYPLRPSRRHRRGGHCSRQTHGRPFLYQTSSARIRYFIGKRRCQPEPGTTAVAQHRPCRHRRPAYPVTG